MTVYEPQKINLITPESIYKQNNPSEDLLFAGTVIQGTVEDIHRIRDFILTQTKARLIYQRRSLAYLKIVPAEATQ